MVCLNVDILSLVVLFAVIVGENCSDMTDQKACEFLWGANQGPSCLWKLGESPACISDFNQCEILGDFCHLDPACHINADGKCAADPCIGSLNADDNTCSNKYCIPHIMYDFDDVSNSFYNFTMCSSPNNIPNTCYYLGFYQRNANNTYTFRNDVCEEYPTVCKHIVVNSPYLSGNYCTDGRRDLCENILDQDACEQHQEIGKDCVFRLGSNPSCVPNFDQCSVLGSSYCHLYPSCYVNDEGKCVVDPCAEELPSSGQKCSNEYCVPHVMYDYSGTNSSFYQWTLCTSPKNTPNVCYYLAHYDFSSGGSFVYNTSVCAHQNSCESVEYDTPVFSGHYCTDGRKELVVSESKGNDVEKNDDDDKKNWSMVIVLLIAIMVVVAVGFLLVGIVLVLVAVVVSRGGTKKEDQESTNRWQAQPEPSKVAQSIRPGPNQVEDYNPNADTEKTLPGSVKISQSNTDDCSPADTPPAIRSRSQNRNTTTVTAPIAVVAEYPDGRGSLSPKTGAAAAAAAHKSKKVVKKKSGKNSSKKVVLVADSSNE